MSKTWFFLSRKSQYTSCWRDAYKFLQKGRIWADRGFKILCTKSCVFRKEQPAVFNGAGLYEPSQRKFYLNGFLKEVWPFWMDCVGIGGITFLPVL